MTTATECRTWTEQTEERWIYSCKRCHEYRTRNLAVTVTHDPKRWNGYVTGYTSSRDYGHATQGFFPQERCPKCRTIMSAHRVEGTYDPDHKCDPRCTGAHGHICDCSCGGQNHGSQWA